MLSRLREYQEVPRKFVAITLSKAATSPLAIGKSGIMPAQ